MTPYIRFWLVGMSATLLICGATAQGGQPGSYLNDRTERRFSRRLQPLAREAVSPPSSSDARLVVEGNTSIRFQSPEDVCRSVTNSVKYQADVFVSEEWQSARATLRSGKGDCEDFAACVNDVCRSSGFASEIIVFSNKMTRQAHAITVGRWNGAMWMASNGSWEAIESLEDARLKTSRAFGWNEADVSRSALPAVPAVARATDTGNTEAVR